MIQHQVEVIINRSAHDVFTFLTTTQNLSKWQDALVQATNLTGEPWSAGTRILERRKIGGRVVETRTELTYVKLDQGFAVKSLDGPQTEGTFQLESANGATRLHFSIQMKMSGIMRLIEPIIAKGIKKDADASFFKLKRLLET
jgi:uncharacterized membrane protein